MLRFPYPDRQRARLNLPGVADGMDIRRHVPQGRRRIPLQPTTNRTRPHAYLGRARRPLDDIYQSDHADGRQAAGSAGC